MIYRNQFILIVVIIFYQICHAQLFYDVKTFTYQNIDSTEIGKGPMTLTKDFKAFLEYCNETYFDIINEDIGQTTTFINDEINLQDYYMKDTNITFKDSIKIKNKHGSIIGTISKETSYDKDKGEISNLHFNIEIVNLDRSIKNVTENLSDYRRKESRDKFIEQLAVQTCKKIKSVDDTTSQLNASITSVNTVLSAQFSMYFDSLKILKMKISDDHKFYKRSQNVRRIVSGIFTISTFIGGVYFNSKANDIRGRQEEIQSKYNNYTGSDKEQFDSYEKDYYKLEPDFKKYKTYSNVSYGVAGLMTAAFIMFIPF